ncbi:hypothetical protein BDV39DRAFT_203341 [Aspergillus sergii]|uniref:6-phosphogluconate dehydrogenase NADP-binding domain-containing protein n=1 Tax=Aspergillus sergii TaxID=1034303 RepID=A0A5N6XC26_9EURO|nr:hypothetical protein BDV39DRAFT_203341 [Aspergillus sergii]
MEPAHVSVIPKPETLTWAGAPCEDCSAPPDREAQHDAALKIIVDEILAAGNIDAKIIINTTTVLPTTSQEVSGKVAQKNYTFISAPMLGSSLMAEDRKILIVLAGDLSGIKKLASYLKGCAVEDHRQLHHLRIHRDYWRSPHVPAEENEMGNGALESLLELQFRLLPSMISKRLTKGDYMLPRGENP